MFFIIRRICAVCSVVFLSLIIASGGFSEDKTTAEDLVKFEATASASEAMKLAIFPPLATVYNAPFGEPIGKIKRGRVIYLLASEGEWINFTTREYPDAWILWESTITLEDWKAFPPYDSTAAYITLWEKGVKEMETEIDTALANILVLRDAIAEGIMAPREGIGRIERERAAIEDSFRKLHRLRAPEPLATAVELLEGKRWAINQGLGYLIVYLQGGEDVNGIAAGKYFEIAENMMYRYSREMFQVKSKYKLYDEK